MGKPKDRRYTPTAQALHWLIALLIVAQFVLARMVAPLPLGARKLALLAEHKSFGMTVFMLAAIRFAWRLKNPPPSRPADMHRVERFLARFTHVSGAEASLLEQGRRPRSNASRISIGEQIVMNG